jgi:FkbM family methyltransferase
MHFLKQKIYERLYGGDIQRLIAQNKVPDQEVSLKRIKNLMFNPNVIYDVGGYQGDFTDMCLQLWPHAQAHIFEGLPDKVTLLEKRFYGKNVKVNKLLVGEENKDDIQFYADETASSILESHEMHPKTRINTQMVTLDTYIQAGHPVPNFLKIDTQGYEYHVLKGCEKYLHQVEIILIELNFTEIYFQSTLAHHVIHHLANHGFVIYDVCEIHRRPLDNALVQMDFLFVKENSLLRKDKRWAL